MARQRWVAALGVLATLFVLAVGRADEADAVKTIEKAGGKITVDEKAAKKPAVAVIMWGPGFNVDLLKELKEFKNLEKLRIGGPWITDAGLQNLKEIKTLKVLEIRSPRVTDAALKELGAALPKLKIRRAAPGETPFAEPK
ncbi:MAG: hypothetical protein U0793_18690 [Gemmataceae bacterium]